MRKLKQISATMLATASMIATLVTPAFAEDVENTIKIVGGVQEALK